MELKNFRILLMKSPIYNYMREQQAGNWVISYKGRGSIRRGAARDPMGEDLRDPMGDYLRDPMGEDPAQTLKTNARCTRIPLLFPFIPRSNKFGSGCSQIKNPTIRSGF